jgi:phosphoenolpyruvate carboxykinase (ATP)
MTNGRVNPDQTLENTGVSGLGTVHYNLLEPALIEAALRRGEGRLGKGGTFLVSTGKFTGRSPKDKFVVRTPAVETDLVGKQRGDGARRLRRLHADMLEHMKGGNTSCRISTAAPIRASPRRACCHELAWHNLFIRHLLRRPERAELDTFVPEFTIINCPSFKADPERHGCRTDTVIALNFEKKLILIGNTEYAGENKKSVFTLLNYLLPEKGVMPMHCSANHADGEPESMPPSSSASRAPARRRSGVIPTRTLIGDDEHGWSDRGTFNFEGGCYAKTINLREEAEPEIYATTGTSAR